MTDEQQQVEILDDVVDATPPPKKRCSSLLLVGFAAVLGLGASAGVYGLWQQQLRLASKSLQRAEAVQLLQTEQQQLQKVSDEQGQALQAVAAGMNQLRLASQASADQWRLAEIEHLIRLAEHHASLEQNVTVSLQLMLSAERRLAALADPELHRLKQAVAASVSALQAVPTVDVESVIIRLGALSQTLGELPLNDSYAHQFKAETVAVSDRMDWRQQWAKSLQRLQSVISIRHLDKPSQAILPPQQHEALVESIQLQISMAQWAVIQRQPVVYQQTLTQAMQWIKQYLRETTATGAIHKGLHDLAKMDVAPTLPSLAKVLKAAQQALSEQASQRLSSSPPPAPSQPSAPAEPQPKLRSNPPQVLSS